MKIANRHIGPNHPPLVIAEIGINHEGDKLKALQMIDAAKAAGCECVKFQCHVPADEMIPNNVIPGNATESIWDMMNRCALTEDVERALKDYTQSLGMIYLSTPFGRAAANRLNAMDVPAFKIGSGECNNYPLIEHIAKFRKPIILSTGMNNIASILPALDILKHYAVPYAVMHCTSMYPTPYNQVHLGAIAQLQEYTDGAPVGLSDHSLGNYTSFAAVALGCSIVEKHFTLNKRWPGPDIPISIDPTELADLIKGTHAIWQASGGSKMILKGEQPTINFAYACVVAIADIKIGDKFTMENIWVKRPGTGELRAADFYQVLGKTATRDINLNDQIKKSDYE